MEKGLQLTSYMLHKAQKCSMSTSIHSADRFSGLPEDILLTILSRLPMEEAARTTILSHRWRNLWTHTTGTLDFDGSDILWTLKLCFELGMTDTEIEPYRPGYISWVNQILNSHKGATIDELKVHFALDLTSRLDIDGWINFALQKRARKLEINLYRLELNWEKIYPFPSQYLGHPTINSLRSLKLNFVDVTGEVLESFFSNCPFLEIVSVKSSPCLVGVKVSAASPKLKYLEIIRCYHMEFLDISSINLTSLTYSGPVARLCFKNAPNLTDVSFGGAYCVDIVQRFHNLPIPLSRIEKLKLHLVSPDFVRFSEFPELKNLKQLELTLVARDRLGLLSCTSLLKECPMLCRLSVQFHWVEDIELINVQNKECELKSLKFVELSGFRGGTADVELAMYLIANAPALKKITIDTRNPIYLGTPFDVLDKEDGTAKECAKLLLTETYYLQRLNSSYFEEGGIGSLILSSFDGFRSHV